MEGFDLVVGGVALIPLVLGITQLFKEWFGWTEDGDEKKVKITSFVVAVVIIAVAQVMPFLPENVGKIVEIVFGVLAFSLASQGLYQIGSNFASRVAK